jgi:putative oxidoreductase
MSDETSNIDERRLLIPGLAGLYRSIAPLAYAFIRVVTALSFLPVGLDRLFHDGATELAKPIAALGFAYPYAWGWAVTLTESIGAILLGLGLFTRPAAFAIAVEMAVVAFDIMIKHGMFWPAHGLEVALLLGLVAFGFVLGGGGRYSLDRLIGREF